MYIWGYQTPVFIPIRSKNLIFSDIFPLGTNVNLGVPNSGFYPHQVKKTSFLVKFFHFYGTNVHLGVPNSSFYPHRVKKNFIFSEIFPFLGNKCTFGGIKLQFLSPSGQKTSFLVKFFHFYGTNVHLGVPNSSFYPHRVKKKFIFSEIFPFLVNKCTFGGTKLQFLSQ